MKSPLIERWSNTCQVYFNTWCYRRPQPQTPISILLITVALNHPSLGSQAWYAGVEQTVINSCDLLQ
jgi:hypothetical protein